MSLRERYGSRDLTYSRWHRTLHHFLTYIDIDFLEYCHFCKEPLALGELARDVGQEHKATTVLRKLAERANLRAYLIFYSVHEDSIIGFRVRQVWPLWGEETALAPEEYEAMLFSLRDGHVCTNPAHALMGRSRKDAGAPTRKGGENDDKARPG